MKKFIFLLLFFYSLVNIRLAEGATYYVRVTGNWNALTTWSNVACGGAMAAVLPGPADNIIVCVGTTVTVNVNATVTNVTINNGGTLQNGGGSTTNRTLTVTGTLNIMSGGTLIQNSTIPAATSLFAGTEIFDPAGTVTVTNWSSVTTPLISGVNSNFGHLNLNWNTTGFWWNNQGLGVTRSILGNFGVGANCNAFLDSTSANILISIGGSLTVNGKLRVKNAMAGTVGFTVTGNATVGATGVFSGIYGGSNQFNFTVVNLTTIAGSTFNGIENGIGNTVIAINGIFNSAGNFYGINAPLLLNNGVPTITMNSLMYSGGTFMASYAHNIGGTASVNIAGNATITFTIASDNIKLLGLPGIGANNSTTKLNLVVGGNLSVGGFSTCEFKTSESYGEEILTVTGTFTSTAAKTIINGGTIDASGHKVRATLGGFTISGGTVWFSENSCDSANYQVNGNVLLTGGTFILKSSTGYAMLNVSGAFTQNFAGSAFYMHGPDQLGAATAGNNFTDLKVNGVFTQSGGILTFDITDSPTEQRIYINGPSYTVSNTASMIRAGAGSSLYFAKIFFQYPGTTTYFRNLSHNIQQCKQTIKTGCTLNVTSGPFQVSSHTTAFTDMLTVEGGAVLSMGGNQLTSDSLFSNSGISLLDNARLRFSRVNGLYDGTANAVISSAGNMNYSLGANSTVEYNTSTYARVTGINVGIATLPQHKYGILEINHTGPAGTWVSPTYLPNFTSAVYIRTKLVMTSGEFNLADASGSPVTGGRWVMLENPSPTALVRTGGYIRSEVLDHSARLVWTINGVAGTYLIPWGNSVAEYIPLTYQLTSGTVGTVSFSTYRTPASNLPWPPGVTNLTSHIGLSPDNRTATVDRFWRMANTGTNPLLNLTFNYVASELPGIPYNLPAQIRGYGYNTTTNKWMAALPGQTAAAYQVTVPAAGGLTHWALASLNSPLPVEWLYVKASAAGNKANVEWSTASEVNCDYYSVYRSHDAINFECVGKRNANGTSSLVHTYYFEDPFPYADVTYYKILQTDFDGQYSWSDIASFTKQALADPTFYWMSTDPGKLNIQLHATDISEIKIYDPLGKLVKQLNNISGSNFDIPLPISAGKILLVQIVSGNRAKTYKVPLQ